METLGGLFGSAYTAIVDAVGRVSPGPTSSTLGDQPMGSQGHGDDDDDATAPLNTDWMLVVEDRASVRAVPIDVQSQQLRNRPGLTRLWDGTDTADLLIERPLVDVTRQGRTDLSYAAVAATGVPVPVALPAIVTTTKTASTTTAEDWSPPVYIRVGRTNIAPMRAASTVHGDAVDWIDLCKGDRVTRRFMSRQQRFKAHPMPGRAPTKIRKQRHITVRC